MHRTTYAILIQTLGDCRKRAAKSVVFGEVVSREALPELSAVRIRVRLKGVEVATAKGIAVLGHPYNSVAWLASKLARFGERIREGYYIMSGLITRQSPLDREGIGAVTASLI